MFCLSILILGYSQKFKFVAGVFNSTADLAWCSSRYESGWGKKLSYVLAFSKDEVVDVTWRYSANFSDLQERRNRVSEAWLRSRMAQLSNRLQLRLSLNDKSIIRRRRFREAVEFLTPRTVKDSEIVRET